MKVNVGDLVVAKPLSDTYYGIINKIDESHVWGYFGRNIEKVRHEESFRKASEGGSSTRLKINSILVLIPKEML